jgi:hypothetical protein
METTHSPALATVGRVLVGLAVTAGAAYHALLWLFVAALQCDESCDGGSWQVTPGAWQWTAMGVLGFASFVLTLAFAVAFAVRSSPRWLTVGLAAAAAATAIAPWIINAT